MKLYQLRVVQNDCAEEQLNFTDVTSLFNHVFKTPAEALLIDGNWVGWQYPPKKNSPKVQIFPLCEGKQVSPLDLK